MDREDVLLLGRLIWELEPVAAWACVLTQHPAPSTHREGAGRGLHSENRLLETKSQSLCLSQTHKQVCGAMDSFLTVLKKLYMTTGWWLATPRTASHVISV